MTSKNWARFALLKITSFRQFQISHNIAQTPTWIRALVLCQSHSATCQIFFYACWRWYIESKIDNLPDSLAKLYLRNKCSTDSSESQKAYFLHPAHFLFNKLSFVSNTFLWRNHIKILIFRGTSEDNKDAHGHKRKEKSEKRPRHSDQSLIATTL
jgi:hypothetical protein